jgi:hypothetical protein
LARHPLDPEELLICALPMLPMLPMLPVAWLGERLDLASRRS